VQEFYVKTRTVYMINFSCELENARRGKEYDDIEKKR
jgi:hypothetical protein